MRTMFSIGVAVLCGIVAGASLAQAGDEVNQAWATQSLTSMPLTFTQNMGQWDEQVLFRADAGGATMWITGEGVMYQFVRAVDDPASDATAVFDNADAVTPDFETLIVKTLFVGANVRPSVVGEREMGYKCNYFHGSDPSKWRTDVPNYRGIILDEVYPGIDLAYYGNGQRMEYDFVVSPGADFSRIQIKYEGAESIAVAADGSLSVTTAWGEIKELTPVVYQNVNGERRAVTAEYAVGADNTFGFNLGKDYDRTLPVTIDPELDYSTYLGGSSSDEGWGIDVDTAGSAYVVGYTASTNFPTVDPYQGDQYSGDVFVTKLSSDGQSLIYSTYLGGDSADCGRAIVVGGSGTAYVTGYTVSSDFPTVSQYQLNQAGQDCFVTKLSSSGDSLIFSTYLGGNGIDEAWGIALDAAGMTGSSGAMYVTGYTGSSNFPTLNQYQGDQGGTDGFVTKLSSSGSSLVYSTYLGESETDICYAIAVDTSGAAYVTGGTASADFPTDNAYEATYQGGYNDAFVTNLAANGSSLIYSTFLGGEDDDKAFGIAVDLSLAVYVTGGSASTDFPAVNAYQEFPGPFITKLLPTGVSLGYSTSLGFDELLCGMDIAVDEFGSAYVIGYSQPSNLVPSVVRLASTGRFPVYSMEFEGSGTFNLGLGIAVDDEGAAYLTGYTRSTEFPTVDPYQGTLSGTQDAFVTKIESVSCCLDRVGDVNQSGDDEPTIGDISTLVDALYISGTCDGVLFCLSEADVNQSGGSNPTCENITVGDITMLQDYVLGDQDPDLLGCQ